MPSPAALKSVPASYSLVVAFCMAVFIAAFKAALSAGGRTGIVEAVNFRITYREHQRAVELTAGRDIPAVELNIRSRLYLDGDLGLAGDAYAAEGARRAGGRLPFL